MTDDHYQVDAGKEVWHSVMGCVKVEGEGGSSETEKDL